MYVCVCVCVCVCSKVNIFPEEGVGNIEKQSENVNSCNSTSGALGLGRPTPSAGIREAGHVCAPRVHVRVGSDLSARFKAGRPPNQRAPPRPGPAAASALGAGAERGLRVAGRG